MEGKIDNKYCAKIRSKQLQVVNFILLTPLDYPIFRHSLSFLQNKSLGHNLRNFSLIMGNKNQSMLWT